MLRRLPPLKALQAFEAAARHLSVTKAAEELCVTTAAVSQQLKTLEDYLGAKLFLRNRRALELTEKGRAYLPELRAAFAKLTDAWGRLSGLEDHDDLSVSVVPSLADRWLAPRLVRFQEAHPDLHVRLDACVGPVELSGGDADVIIHCNPNLATGADTQVEQLLCEEIFPVCSPAALRGADNFPYTPNALHAHTLLHLDGNEFEHAYPDWGAWLQAAGLSDVDPQRGPRFNLLHLAIQAAVNGQGVALGGSVIVAQELLTGQLVRPFEFVYPRTVAYYVACTEAGAERPAVAAFRRWLFDEAATTTHGPPESTPIPPYRDQWARRPASRNPHEIVHPKPTCVPIAAENGDETSQFAECSIHELPLLQLRQRIVEQKKVEEALKARVHEFHTFVENAPVELAMLDRDMCYLAASRRWRDTSGIKDQDIRGWSHYAVYRNSPRRWREAHQRGLSGASLECDQDPLPTASGSTQWMRWAIHPWRDPQRDVGGIIVYSENVTDRVVREQTLRDDEHRYRTLFDEHPALCLRVDANGTIQSVNQYGARQFGYTVEQLLGSPLAILYDDDDRGSLYERLQANVQHAEQMRCREARLVDRDGIRRPVAETSRSIRDADGTTSMYIVYSDAEPDDASLNMQTRRRSD